MHLLSFICFIDSQTYVILSLFAPFAYEHVKLSTKSLEFKMGASHHSLFKEMSAQLASHQNQVWK